MRIYLDCCCFNRPYDDRIQEKIHLEGEAILAIINRCKQNNDEIIGSPVLDLENNNICDIEKREKVKYFYNQTISKKIDYTANIFERVKELQKQTNVRTFDIFHLSFAEYSNVDILLTTDIKFEKSSAKINLKTRVINPLKYLMEVI